jgi:hypothetical protein
MCGRDAITCSMPDTFDEEEFCFGVRTLSCCSTDYTYDHTFDGIDLESIHVDRDVFFIERVSLGGETQ